MKVTRWNAPARSPAVAVVVALAAAACAAAPSGDAAGPGPTGGGEASGTSEPSGGAAPPIVQPGAPGEATQPYERVPVSAIEGASYTEADVDFVQGMIHHHAQALEMTALVPSRTREEDFHLMARRMEISQSDEIGVMQSWLRERGEEVPHPGARAGRAHQAHVMMPGMLTPEQMDQLRNATGDEFERLFLELMIQHHQGAITMVRELFGTPGAAQESTVNFFANEVDADQNIEIQRMRSMLRERG